MLYVIQRFLIQRSRHAKYYPDMLKTYRGNCATGKLSMHLENSFFWNEQPIVNAPCEAYGHALFGIKLVVRNS